MSFKNSRRVELGIVAAIVIGSGLFLRFGYTERNYQRTCAANLKMIGIGMMQYIRDYDEKYPPVAEWSRVVWPWVKSTEVFQCPKIGNGGYAMNRYFDGVSLARMLNPAIDPLLFDSTLRDQSASDTGQSWPIPARHRGCNHVGFADAHVACQKIKPKFQPFPRSK